MQKADKRTDQYLELVEMYNDHPDRDRLIAIEMGRDHISVKMDEDENWMYPSDDFVMDDSEEGEKWKQGIIYEDPSEFEEVENFPLYQKAQKFTLDSMDLIQDQLKNSDDESVNAFAASVILPPAKLQAVLGSDSI